MLAGQLAPCLLAGTLLTPVVYENPMLLIGLMPGLWALLFSLGIFALRPNLPRATGWVALFYFAAGIIVISLTAGNNFPSPWSVGLVFGPGQLAGGAVLYWNRERSNP